MKGFKRILFLLAFIFVLPLFGMGCGELKFDDVPYLESGLYTNAEANTLIVNARKEFKGLEINSKIQTVNTYRFYETENTNIKNKIIKDVVNTYLCVDEYGQDKTVSSVETIRYINEKKAIREVKIYVDSTNYSDYCYILTEVYDEEGKEVETTTRNRANYDSGRYSYSNLFDSVFVSAQTDEIDVIYSKSFEGTTYYKFKSELEGLIVANERFEKDVNIQLNPNLFVSINPDRDTVIPFSYEYGVNGNGYLVHAKVNYSILDEYNEKYLTVESVSNVQEYGYSIESLKAPEDADDYTAETLVSTLNSDKSYVTYRNTTEDIYTKTIVGKIGSDENPDYTVKVENYQSNSLSSTNYYYVKYEMEIDPLSQEALEGKYQAYILDIQNKRFTKTDDYVLDLLSFNFNLELKNTTTQDDKKIYKYETNAERFEIAISENEVYSITTETSASTKLEIFIENYGNDFTNPNLNLVESLLGYTENQPEPEETPGDSGESGGESSGESGGESSGESGGAGESV